MARAEVEWVAAEPTRSRWPHAMAAHRNRLGAFIHRRDQAHIADVASATIAMFGSDFAPPFAGR